MTSIKYPVGINSNTDKYAYLYRLQELLRIEHNKKGAEFQEGKLLQDKWDKYQDGDFNPKNELIATEICKYRVLLKKDTKNIAKLSDIVE